MTEPRRYIRLEVEAAEDLAHHLNTISTATKAVEQILVANVYPTPKTVKH